MSSKLTFAERMRHAFSSTQKAEKTETVIQSVGQTVTEVKTDDNEIIAVITAAVTAMFDVKGIKSNFKIKSFRRTK